MIIPNRLNVAKVSCKRRKETVQHLCDELERGVLAGPEQPASALDLTDAPAAA